MKNLLLGIVLGVGLAVLSFMLLLYSPTARLRPPAASVPYSRFIADISESKVEEVTLQGPNIVGRFKDGRLFETLLPHTELIPALTDRLLANKVEVRARPAEDVPSAISIFAAWIPALITYALFFGGLWLFMTRPILALIRQIDASIKAAHHAPEGPH